MQCPRAAAAIPSAACLCSAAPLLTCCRAVSPQVPSQLVACSSLVREVGLLAEVLAPLAGVAPKLGATFRAALTAMFCAASQVRRKRSQAALAGGRAACHAGASTANARLGGACLLLFPDPPFPSHAWQPAGSVQPVCMLLA